MFWILGLELDILRYPAPLSKGMQEIHHVLKSDGLCLCLEWEKKSMEQGPPLHHRIHSDDMKKTFEEHGFKIVNLTFPTDQHYLIVAQK